MVQTSLVEVEVTLSSSSHLAPVATIQTEERSQQRSSRDHKFKPPDGQQEEKKGRKRDARCKSRGRRDEKSRKDQAQPTENEPTQGELKIETAPLKAKFEDMQRRKQRAMF